MEANPRTLDALFNSQLRYVVPMFQRLYVWQGTPQWVNLWEDIVEKADLQLAGVKSNAHYTLLACPKDAAKKSNIDQRLADAHITPLWYPEEEHWHVERVLALLLD